MAGVVTNGSQFSLGYVASVAPCTGIRITRWCARIRKIESNVGLVQSHRVGQIIVRHICATGLLSKPSPSASVA